MRKKLHPRYARDDLRDLAEEMLSALQHMVHWHDQLRPEDIQRAEAAIARATGAGLSAPDRLPLIKLEAIGARS